MKVFPSRITPDSITKLAGNEIFVFGSNLAGRHGLGAAKTAMKWGAIYGQGFGPQGQTFGIPTMNSVITSKLSLPSISGYVKSFIEYAKHLPSFRFLVTEIGCGLAGWTPDDIAPLFKDAIDIPNITLPKNFWIVLQDLT